MKRWRQQKALLHYAKSNKLTENSMQYKAVELYNMFTEILKRPIESILDQQ